MNPICSHQRGVGPTAIFPERARKRETNLRCIRTRSVFLWGYHRLLQKSGLERMNLVTWKVHTGIEILAQVFLGVSLSACHLGRSVFLRFGVKHTQFSQKRLRGLQIPPIQSRSGRGEVRRWEKNSRGTAITISMDTLLVLVLGCCRSRNALRIFTTRNPATTTEGFRTCFRLVLRD